MIYTFFSTRPMYVSRAPDVQKVEFGWCVIIFYSLSLQSYGLPLDSELNFVHGRTENVYE